MNNTSLRIVRVLDGTSVDGPGLRTSVYFAGCAHHCVGCHNEHTWDFMAGQDVTTEELLARIDYNSFGVTFSGGDPMYQAFKLEPLCKAIKERGLSLWCYTGFTFEELLTDPELKDARNLLSYIDVLVDGPFIEAEKNEELLFRGSSNQRLIDVPRSIKYGKIVMWER